MRTILVGFGHRARHGKDTIANLVAGQLPESRILAHADDLKAIARALGMTEKHGPFLQKLGEALRTLDKDYFVKRLHTRIAELQPRVALVPDVRFPNEADRIGAHGGLLYKVHRLNADGTVFVDPTRDPNHESETAMNDYLGWTREFHITSGDWQGLADAARIILADIETVLRAE